MSEVFNLCIPGKQMVEVVEAIKLVVRDKAHEPAEGDDTCYISLHAERCKNHLTLEVEAEKEEEKKDDQPTTPPKKVEKDTAASEIDRAGNQVVKRKL